MLPIAKKYFEDNPEAKSCHVVLSRVFANAKDAWAYKRAYNAKKVTAYLRSEMEAGSGKMEEPPAPKGEGEGNRIQTKRKRKNT